MDTTRRSSDLLASNWLSQLDASRSEERRVGYWPANFSIKISLFQIMPLGPSSALPTQRVWRLFQCCRWSISKWASGFNSKKAGKNVGKIGVPLSDLWEWSLSYRMPRTRSELGASQALQLAYALAAMIKENNLQLAQSMGRSRPLARRSLWPMKEIP